MGQLSVGNLKTKNRDFNNVLDSFANVTDATNSHAHVGTVWGAGAISTEIAPKVHVTNLGGQILTSIHIDLTGLKKKSDVGDAIGLDGVTGAYFLQYKAATHGQLYKAEISCLEAPTAASNNLLDIDVYLHSAIIDYDGDATASSGIQLIDMGGNNMVLGKTTQNLVTGMSNATHDNWYLYLADGATSTGADVFTAGKAVINLYGTVVF